MPDGHFPSSQDMDDSIEIALGARHMQALPAERTVLSRTALGLMRKMIDPTGGVLGTLVTALGLPSVPDQAAQKVVDYWIDGRGDSPPFEHRAQMWPLITKAFHQIHEATPGSVEITALINVAIGILKDQFPNHHGGVKEGVSVVVVDAYAIGF